jgi:hopanoid biosynthesis associated protein HpnK
VSVRQLVVSGDDFGAAGEINAAIARAHRDGILTSTSLMVTGDAVADAVAVARANPTLGVGLHLVLAQARPAAPVSSIPRLVDARGRFGEDAVRGGMRYAAIALGRTGRAQLRHEIEAQLDAFVATGLELAHVDGHLNMHLHPMVLAILLELAPRYGIRAMRLSRESLGSALRHDRRHALRKTGEGLVFHALAAWAAPRLRAAGIVTTDRVYGMHQTGHVDEAYLLGLIPALPPGVSELYCHPAVRPPAVMADAQRGYDHAGELAALLSPRVRACVQESGVRLVSYAGLAGGGVSRSRAGDQRT